MTAANQLRVVSNATCTFCCCTCDDMELTVENDRITKTENACVLGTAWFLNHTSEDRPPALIDGKPATLEEGVGRAAHILAGARYPIVYGLSETTCEAQRVAVAIADRIGACIDTPTSANYGPSGMAFQGIGEVTCSLGEVKNRADLVLFWGVDPVESHPRHWGRYSITPKGLFVPNGRTDRTVVLVDVRRCASASEADLFIPIEPGKDFEALWALRALVKGVEMDEGIAEETGIPLATLRDLAKRMKACKFGVLFFGTGLSMTRGKHLNVEAALGLAQDLNAFTRFYARPMMPGPGNGTGADNVLTWSTGYPFGVNLGRGYPRFNPGEFTTSDTLARGEADAALIVAGDPMDGLSQSARDHLVKIPYVALAPKESPPTRAAAVAFTTATYGINTPGTVYRMDDIPILLRPAFDSPHPSDETVLTAIEKRIRALQEEGCGKCFGSAYVD